MRKRFKMSRGKSNRNFRRGARTKANNHFSAPMRGGIRL